MASIIPGNLSTYTFTDEKSYYEDYATSVFGQTCKKGGWDCMRHYEILANGCIPWFEGLNDCPENTMTHFPKKLVKEAMTSSNPESFIPELLEYTKTHLTTKAMAQYIFNTVDCPNPKRVLFISSDPSPDYLRCLTLSGMKELLGKNCSESPHIPHIYDDYGQTDKLYGKGFSYTGSVSAELKTTSTHIDELRNHAFDLIVYGSLHRGMPYYDEVMKVYKPSEVILLCGEDIHVDKNCFGLEFAKKGHPVFIRELQDYMNIVQIGTNNGIDHVRDLVGKILTNKILLVEPFDIHNQSIKNSYSTIDHIIENIAIVPDDSKIVKLYYHKDDGPENNVLKSFQVASIIPEHIKKHNYNENTIQHIDVPAYTLNKLLEKHSLYKIDYLFLDIEGIDMEVLESIDFSTYDIKRLQIEHLHIDANKLHSFMTSKGYRSTNGIDYYGFDTMFIKN